MVWLGLGCLFCSFGVSSGSASSRLNHSLHRLATIRRHPRYAFRSNTPVSITAQSISGIWSSAQDDMLVFGICTSGGLSLLPNRVCSAILLMFRSENGDDRLFRGLPFFLFFRCL